MDRGAASGRHVDDDVADVLASGQRCGGQPGQDVGDGAAIDLVSRPPWPATSTNPVCHRSGVRHHTCRCQGVLLLLRFAPMGLIDAQHHHLGQRASTTSRAFVRKAFITVGQDRCRSRAVWMTVKPTSRTRGPTCSRTVIRAPADREAKKPQDGQARAPSSTVISAPDASRWPATRRSRPPHTPSRASSNVVSLSKLVAFHRSFSVETEMITQDHWRPASKGSSHHPHRWTVSAPDETHRSTPKTPLAGSPWVDEHRRRHGGLARRVMVARLRGFRRGVHAMDDGRAVGSGSTT